MVAGPAHHLDVSQARALQLSSQGLLRQSDNFSHSADIASQLGGIQLDTISVLARSHELVPLARLRGATRDDVVAQLWPRDGEEPRMFEYWSHAACLLPVEMWPLFSFRRRSSRTRGWSNVDSRVVKKVLRTLKTDGPQTATQLGGAKAGGTWWSWSAEKIALEYLLAIGELVCTTRIGWRRVYDLPERALPDHVLAADELSDQDCYLALAAHALRSLAIATIDDLADTFRLPKSAVSDALVKLDAVPCTVSGWDEPAYAYPRSINHIPDGRKSVTVALSPFDSLVWFRPRLQRMFSMEHRLEAYTPSAQRVHGYFAMPVLHAGRLISRIDPKHTRGLLTINRVTFQPTRGGDVSQSAIAGTAQAIHTAAQWVGARNITIDDVRPAGAATALRRAVAS